MMPQMSIFRRFAVLILAVNLSSLAQAGYIEISANGSYLKYNYGIVASQPAYTVSKKGGGGLAYRLMSNTSLELKYTYSNSLDVGAADIESEPVVYYLNKVTEFHNLSMNVALEFADKKATFRPFISGGGGYMIRKIRQTGRSVDRDTAAESTLVFAAQPEVRSTSADASLGFKVFVTESVAIEVTGTVFATDLDKPEIYLHYSASGGLRFIF